jgi:hypothetical protein
MPEIKNSKKINEYNLPQYHIREKSHIVISIGIIYKVNPIPLFKNKLPIGRNFLYTIKDNFFFLLFCLFLLLYSYMHTIFGSFLAPSPCLLPYPFTPYLTSLPASSLTLPIPRYQAETILSLSLVLFKREYKQ